MKSMMKRILAVWVALLLALTPLALAEAGEAPVHVEQQETKGEPAIVKQEEPKSEPAPDKQEAPKSEPASEGETGGDAAPDGKQDQQDDAAPGEAQSGGSVPVGDDAKGGDEPPSDAPAQEPAQPADAGDAKAADPSVPADGDEAQDGEDEGSEQPAEPVELDEEESDPEEAVEEEPVLLAVPALKARALLAAGVGAYTGICRYCGQPVEAEYKDESNHIVTCYYGGCKHYNHELYTGHWGGTATCTEQAICGSCGHTYCNTDPNNHDFSINVPAKAATCTEIGYSAHKKCSRCQATNDQYVEIPAKGHDWGAWTPDPDDPKSHYRLCKRDGCGAKGTEAHHADEIRNTSTIFHVYWCFVCASSGRPYLAQSHSYGDWQDNGDGTHSRSCICGRTEPEGHSYGDWQDNEDGTHSRSCICGATETVAHTYTWTYVDDDTHKGVCACGAETTEAHYDRWASTCGRQPHCEKCDHDYGSIPEHEMWYEDRGESGHKPSCYHCDTYFFLEPHTYGDWKDNEDGTHTGVCVCGRTQTVEHTFGDWKDNGDGTHTGVCKCGRTQTVEHSGGTATCTEKAKCEACGVAYGDALGHDWDVWKHSEGKNHSRTCKRGCGATETEEHHADCYINTNGSIHQVQCMFCESQSIWNSEPHTYGDWQDNEDGTHSRSCICGRTETVAHTYTWTYVDDDTCKGVCACGAETTEAHDWGPWKPVGDKKNHTRSCQHEGCGATETEAHHKDWIQNMNSEKHQYVCNVCSNGGTAFGSEPHTITAGTDNDDGTHTGTCICGRSLTEAHSGGTATCTRGPICEKCGVEYDKPLGHDLKATARVEPTCTSTGTEAYWTCQRDGCGKRFSDAEGENEIEEPVVIPATGHTPGAAIRENVRSATCTASGGYDEVVYCAVCKVELSRKAVTTPAQGHDYGVSRRTITVIRSRCGRCGDTTWKYNPKSRSLLPGLVRDGGGNPVDYIAGVSRPEDARLLTVTPDQDPLPEAVALWLETEAVEQWLHEGIDRVVFRRENAVLEIELSEISPDWFPGDMDAAEIDYYVFILAPDDGGTLVKAEALIGETTLPAARIAGVTLQTGDGGVIIIAENGAH